MLLCCKGVNRVCRDSGGSGPGNDFCVLKKKGVYLYSFYGGIFSPDKQLADCEGTAHSDTAAIARDGRTICVARKKMYVSPLGLLH